MSGYGMKVTKEGHNVLDQNLAIKDFSLHSDYESPKIDNIYSGTFIWDYPSPPNGTKTITIAHGLDYVPQAIAMARMIPKSDAWRIPFDITVSFGFTSAIANADLTIDDTNVVLQFDSSDGTIFSWNYYSVIVLRNPIEES